MDFQDVSTMVQGTDDYASGVIRITVWILESIFYHSTYGLGRVVHSLRAQWSTGTMVALYWLNLLCYSFLKIYNFLNI